MKYLILLNNISIFIYLTILYILKTFCVCNYLVSSEFWFQTELKKYPCSLHPQLPFIFIGYLMKQYIARKEKSFSQEAKGLAHLSHERQKEILRDSGQVFSASL